jgi:hypothetical protein
MGAKRDFPVQFGLAWREVLDTAFVGNLGLEMTFLGEKMLVVARAAR